MTKPRATKKPGRGGARAGAGRPRERLPQSDIDALGDPPRDLAGQRAWVHAAMLALARQQLAGGVSADYACSARATLDKLLDSLSRAVERDDDDDDDENEGPDLEPDLERYRGGNNPDAALRVEVD